MSITIRALDDCVLLTVAGEIDARRAGLLYEALVGCSCCGSRRVVVDLAGVDLVTRAGIRGLIVASECVACAGREFRICRARPDIAAELAAYGLNLLTRDPTPDFARAVPGCWSVGRQLQAAAWLRDEPALYRAAA